MEKFFKKSKKPYFSAFWAKMSFPELCQFLNINIIYHRAGNLKKIMCHSWAKMLNWEMDEQIEGQAEDNCDFSGPSVGRGSNY